MSDFPELRRGVRPGDRFSMQRNGVVYADTIRSVSYSSGYRPDRIDALVMAA